MLNRGARYLNFFAGAGGLADGFAQIVYTPLAHIEIDSAVCNTAR
jgi:DNA (cytosine-5)-methyltransferase 1